MAAHIDPKEAASKQRIISHMNKDHQDSLVRYIEHQRGLPPFFARQAKLVDISLKGMVILANNTRNHIMFKPELKDWSEVRPRVVQMDHDAIAALGRSPVTLKRFELPSLIDLIPTVLSIGLAIVAFVPSVLAPGSFVANTFFGANPALAVKLQDLAFKGTLGLIAAHIVETIFLSNQVLSKHSVSTGSALWWQYCVASLFEGIILRLRIARVVKAKEDKLASTKH